MAELDDIAEKKLMEDGIVPHMQARRAFLSGWCAAVEHIEKDLRLNHESATFAMNMERMMKDSDGPQG